MTSRLFNLLRNSGMVLQTLSLYGACGIVCLGWTLSRLLHFDCRRYSILWFSAAVFIYNVDRLKADPTDPINTPLRNRAAARFRRASLFAAVIAVVALALIPVLTRDWLMMALTLCGAFVCINYSVSLLGFRFKDIPLLKTFFAPTLVTAAFLVPPFLQQSHGVHALNYAIVTTWTWCVLMFNMVLCDVRDIDGDSRMGIKSVPVVLGFRGSMWGLAVLLALVAIMSVTIIMNALPGNETAWRNMSLGTLLYLAALFATVLRRRAQPESFYEWWVEGILFVPPLIYWLTR